MTAKIELTWEVDKATGCWNVTSHAPNTKGYPQIMRDGDRILAHRYVWEQAHGPIRPGMCVCHKCDNPTCINPGHLFLGTVADNNRDRDEKGRSSRTHQPKGEAHGQAKLTDDQIRYIRQHTEISIAKMGEKMGVVHSLISMIRSGKAWKHLL